MADAGGESSLEKYLIRDVPVVRETDSVQGVLTLLEKESNKYDSVDYVYVTDKADSLIGMFSVQELFNNPKATKVQRFMKKTVVTVSLHSELAKVSHLALKNKLKQVPVTKSGKLIGVVSSRQILSTINKSLLEDLMHFAGIHKSHVGFENMMEAPMLSLVKSRVPWLLVGLFGAMCVAAYIGLFEGSLTKYPIIAAFLPAIVYMSDALGTQIQTVFIRDMAMWGESLELRGYLLRQMALSLIISAIIGAILFAGIAAFWSGANVAFAISLACIIALMVTSLSALLSTILINRFRFDPALGSGPIATIISDATSIVIYFIVVVALL